MGMLSVPGLIIPLMALPSQLRTRTMSRLWIVLPAQVPSHDPFRGWPSCATTGEVPVSHEPDSTRRRIHDRIVRCPSGQVAALYRGDYTHIRSAGRLLID